MDWNFHQRESNQMFENDKTKKWKNCKTKKKKQKKKKKIAKKKFGWVDFVGFKWMTTKEATERFFQSKSWIHSHDVVKWMWRSKYLSLLAICEIAEN